MTKEELVQQLHGNEYTKEITKDQERIAKENRLVVVFGGSDDLIEFRGAIHDEAGAGEVSDHFIYKGRLLDQSEYDCDCRWSEAALKDAKERSAKITARWSEDGYSWIYKTDIPHATFDVMDEGDMYCQGIVFSLNDLKESEAA